MKIRLRGRRNGGQPSVRRHDGRRIGGPRIRWDSDGHTLGARTELVARLRHLAQKAGRPVVDLATRHTTVSVERATLRLAGLAGADHEGVPWVNHLVDAVREQVGLEHGVSTPGWDALSRG